MLFILTLSAVPSYHLPKTTQFNEQCHKYFAQLEYPRVCIIGLLKSLYYTKCSLYTHVLLVKRGVKTAKYWPSSFIRFFSSRSIKTQKRTGQYTCKSIFIQQAWSIKNLSYGQKTELFLAGNNAGNLEAAWWAYLTVANQSAGFASSCPLTDSVI